MCFNFCLLSFLSINFLLGKAFSFVALIQNIDIVIGTVSSVEIYKASIDFFPGLVFIFAAATRIVALIFIL